MRPLEAFSSQVFHREKGNLGREPFLLRIELKIHAARAEQCASLYGIAALPAKNDDGPCHILGLCTLGYFISFCPMIKENFIYLLMVFIWSSVFV